MIHEYNRRVPNEKKVDINYQPTEYGELTDGGGPLDPGITGK